jgi:hypothetical protein
MITTDFITALVYRVDNKLGDAKHPLVGLYPSEVVTFALLYALKGTGSPKTKVKRGSYAN